MNLLYLTQLYRKHLSQYLYLCILDSQYLIMKNSCACFLFTGVCQLSHLPTSPWCQLLLPWWLYPPRADFDFPTHSPCQRPYCEDCLWYKSRDECFMLRPYSTYHCVNQLHIFLHFLFSIIICDPWKTKSFIVIYHVRWHSILFSLGNVTRQALTLTSPGPAPRAATGSALLSAPQSIILCELLGPKTSPTVYEQNKIRLLLIDECPAKLELDRRTNERTMNISWTYVFTSSRILVQLRSRVPSPWEPSRRPACHC